MLFFSPRRRKRRSVLPGRLLFVQWSEEKKGTPRWGSSLFPHLPPPQEVELVEEVQRVRQKDAWQKKGKQMENVEYGKMVFFILMIARSLGGANAASDDIQNR